MWAWHAEKVEEERENGRERERECVPHQLNTSQMLKYGTFRRETLKYGIFCRETLKYGTFCRKTLKYALRENNSK